MKTDLQIVRDARALIENGWCRGQMHKVSGPFWNRRDKYCAVGALISAAQHDCIVGNRLAGRMSRLVLRECYSLMSFNDAVARNKLDVLAVFDRMIKILEQEEKPSVPKVEWHNDRKILAETQA